MILRGAQMALASLVPFQGPKKSRFSGPTPSNAPHNDVAPLKIITYRAIKTTGTLIVIINLNTKNKQNCNIVIPPPSFARNTVRKMGLILRSIQRMLKMARNFTLQPIRRYDVKPLEKTAQAQSYV